MTMPIGLEKYLIDPAKWNEDESWRDVAPADIRSLVDDAGPGRPSVGLGRHPEKGWFVMVTGQGPAVAWSQWGIEKTTSPVDGVHDV